MAGYVSPVFTHNPTPGLVIPAAWGDAVDTGLDYLATLRCHCRVFNSANISIANATFTALTFNSERYDTGAMHSTSSNTGRITVPTSQDGVFDSKGWISFAANAVADRGAMIRLNGATYIGRDIRATSTAAATSDLAVPVDYSLVATDYLELVAYQNSGGALNVLASGNYSPEFSARWWATG